MSATVALRSEEQLGLLVALALHAALVAVLLLQPADRKPFPLPERMVVSLATDVRLTSTAPNPSREAQASIAPTLSDLPAPAPELSETLPEPAKPRPEPKATPQPAPKPKPVPKSVAKPAEKPTPKPKPKKAESSAKPAQEKPAPKKGGGSRIGDDFLKGESSGSRSTSNALPASQVGAAAKASLVSAISRQLRPYWKAPEGVDADLLITTLAFDLNEDGSLAGAPRVVGQSGINDSNKPQADLHAEQAIKAVKLAAPFDLPPEYYNVWKRITAFRFDRKLSR